MKTIMALLMLFALSAQDSGAQWKQKPKPKKTVSERTIPKPAEAVSSADSSVYTTSFAASFGYVSSAETFRESRFYGGILNLYQVIDAYSYLNFWVTLPGTNQEDQSFGLSYNRELLIPFEEINLDWNVGVLALLPKNPVAKSWIGIPIGLRGNYRFMGAVSLYAVLDAVPAYNVNQNTPSGVDKFGLTVLGQIGIAVTP